MDVTSNQVYDEAFEAGRQEAIKELNEWLKQERVEIEREFNYHNQFVVGALLSFIETLQEKFLVK